MPTLIGDDSGLSDTMVFVRSEESERESPSLCKVMTGDIAFAMADAIRNSLVNAALLGELVRVASELNHEDLSPSEEAQKTWLGIVIFSVAAATGLGSSIVNYIKRDHYPAAQDFVEILLSASYLYIFLELFKKRPITTTEFVFSNFCVPPLVLLLNRIHLSDSTNQINNPLKPVEFQADQNPDRMTYAINMFTASRYMGGSLLALTSVIIGQIEKETQPLQFWQACLIALALIPAIKIGYELNQHQKLFNCFVVATKSLKEMGLMYKALSGFFYMIAVYNWCADQKYCLNKNAETFLSVLSFLMVATLGVFVAATTRFNFEGNAKKIEQTKKIPGAIQDRFRLIGNKIANCCKKENADETGSLVPGSYASIA